MTRKDLQEKFNIIGDNKDISLYRKKGEYTYGIGYCGSIALKNGKAIFNGKSYSTIPELDNALVEWENSLPYPVDTYNPLLRVGARIESQIVWYLTNKLGFELNRRDWETNYIKNIGPSYRLEFSIKDNLKEEKVTITSKYGSLIFTQDADNTESGVAIVSAIVNSECLTMAKDMVDIISACDEKIATEIDAYVPDNHSIIGFRKTDFKGLMVERLEKVLKELKGE